MSTIRTQYFGCGYNQYVVDTDYFWRATFHGKGVAAHRCANPSPWGTSPPSVCSLAVPKAVMSCAVFCFLPRLPPSATPLFPVTPQASGVLSWRGREPPEARMEAPELAHRSVSHACAVRGAAANGRSWSLLGRILSSAGVLRSPCPHPVRQACVIIIPSLTEEKTEVRIPQDHVARKVGQNQESSGL